VEPPGWSDVAAAAERLRGLVDRTPAARSRTLSAISGCDIVVKFENLQYTGSFKDRGAANRLALLSPHERAAGVVAVSAGNHAQGVAYHAARLGVPATILMPLTTPLAKVADTRRLGADVVQLGRTVAEALAGVDEHRAAGRTFIHPYDDPAVVAGQGTVGIELLSEHPDLDVIVVPVGGGGLASGVALAAAQLRPTCRVVGVQSELYPAMADLLAGRPTRAGGDRTSVADGIAVKTPGRIARRLLPALGVECVTVSEDRIEEAIGLLAEREKTVAEGAGAAPLAAVLADPASFRGQRVGLVVSGGNIDPRLCASVLMRSLVRQGRLTRLRVETDDLPGSLGRIASTVGREGGNLIEVIHERLVSAVPVRRVDVELLVETLDAAHLERIRGALEAEGDAVTRLSP